MCETCKKLMNKIFMAKRQGFTGLANMYQRDLEKHQAEKHPEYKPVVQWQQSEWTVRG